MFPSSCGRRLAACSANTCWVRGQPCPSRTSKRVLRCRAANNADVEVPDATYSLVAQYASKFRGLPLWAGGVGGTWLIANRLFSGVSPVVDAGSSQSRADVLGIILCAVLILTGLQWLSLKPKPPTTVVLEGSEILWIDSAAKLPPAAISELRWAWDSLRSSTRTKSMVVLYQGRTVFHAGFIRPGAKPGAFAGGPLCSQAMSSGQGNYLANLVLFPGRTEFLAECLPDSTQGVALQPVGSSGVLLVGTDTLRGISRVDQAWLSAIADKLDSTLEGYAVPQPGLGFAAGKASAKSKPVTNVKV